MEKRRRLKAGAYYINGKHLWEEQATNSCILKDFSKDEISLFKVRKKLIEDGKDIVFRHNEIDYTINYSKVEVIENVNQPLISKEDLDKIGETLTRTEWKQLIYLTYAFVYYNIEGEVEFEDEESSENKKVIINPTEKKSVKKNKKGPVSKKSTTNNYNVSVIGDLEKAEKLKKRMINPPWAPGKTNLDEDTTSKKVKTEEIEKTNSSKKSFVPNLKLERTVSQKRKEFDQACNAKNKRSNDSRKQRKDHRINYELQNHIKSEIERKKEIVENLTSKEIKENKGNTRSPYNKKYFENKLKEKKANQNANFKNGGKDKPKFQPTKKTKDIKEISPDYLDKLQKNLSNESYTKWLKTFSNHLEKKKEKIEQRKKNEKTFFISNILSKLEIKIPIDSLQERLIELKKQNSIGSKYRAVKVMKTDDEFAYITIGPLVTNKKWRSEAREEERKAKATRMNYVVWEKKGSPKQEKTYDPNKTLICIMDSKKNVYRIDRDTAKLAIEKDPSIVYIDKTAWKSGKKAGMSFNHYDLNKDKTSLDRYNDHITELKRLDDYHHNIHTNIIKRRKAKLAYNKRRSYFKQQVINSRYNEGFENAKAYFNLVDWPEDITPEFTKKSKPGEYYIRSYNKSVRSKSNKEKQAIPEPNKFIDAQLNLINELKSNLGIKSKKDKKRDKKLKYASKPNSDGLTCKQRREAKYKLKRANRKPLVDAQTELSSKKTFNKGFTEAKRAIKSKSKKVKQNIKAEV